MEIEVYQSESDKYIKMKLLGKLKYIGESFGVEGLTNGKIYNCVGYDENMRLLSIVDDSEENYMYPIDNPRPLDGTSIGGKWETVEIYDEKLKELISTQE